MSSADTKGSCEISLSYPIYHFYIISLSWIADCAALLENFGSIFGPTPPTNSVRGGRQSSLQKFVVASSPHSRYAHVEKAAPQRRLVASHAAPYFRGSIFRACGQPLGGLSDKRRGGGVADVCEDRPGPCRQSARGHPAQKGRGTSNLSRQESLEVQRSVVHACSVAHAHGHMWRGRWHASESCAPMQHSEMWSC